MRKTVLILACAAAVAASAKSSWAQDLPGGYGVVTASGSTFQTTIGSYTVVANKKIFTNSSNDYDDYVFKGYPGVVLTVVVKPASGDQTLVPLVDFVRPGGSTANEEDGFVFTQKKGKYTATMPLDAAGWWQVRVHGKDISIPTTLPTPPAAPVYSAGDYSVQITYKLPTSLPTLPVVTKSFARTGTIDTNSDTDDYKFEGYAGQTLSSSVTATSGSLLPGISLFRPDGSRVVGSSAIGVKTITKFIMDQQGTWRVRVQGLDPAANPDPQHNHNTTGPYSLSVSLGKPPTTPTILPDSNGQYQFPIPATGGSKITYNFSVPKGAVAPKFNALRDPTGRAVPNTPAKTSVSGFPIPPVSPVGIYLLSFDAAAGSDPIPNAKFSSKMTPPKAAKSRKATLSADEPVIVIGQIYPKTGAENTRLSVATAGKIVDPNDQDASKVAVFIDHVACLSVTLVGSTIDCVVPAGLALGLHDVVVQSTTGQVAVSFGAFEVIPPPTVTAIDPSVGSVAGNYPLTITGSGFLKLSTPAIVINGLTSDHTVPVSINKATLTDTSITFNAPPYGQSGPVTFGVIDADNNVGALLPNNSFQYTADPAINRVVPNLISVLGGTQIVVTGANFKATDKLYLETGTKGTYQLFTNTYTAGVNGGAATHRFIAPVHPKGVYFVYVTDVNGNPNPPRTRTLTYFQFSNLANQTQNVFPSGSDSWDGVTTAAADYDKDGADDLFISRVGGGAAAATSQTRVLKNNNDGTGSFSDVTATVMPAVTSNEDWRADRIWVTEVDAPDSTQPSFPDIVIVSNDSTVLSASSSHVRILINEPKSGTDNTRVFRDRTSTIFPSVRLNTPLYGGGGGVADNWRGLDMWVGDVDGASGPPEILITHKETKQEVLVSCTPYCSSPFSQGYGYAFYWGGSRAFQWDKSKNGGLGKYKFNYNFFPRKSGLTVPIVAPGGQQIPICASQYGQPCAGKFTPFLGKRIAVGPIDVTQLNPQQTSLPDVAVLSDSQVQRIYPPAASLVTISSLQVGINVFNTADGALITDVTDVLTAMGTDLSGDTVEIGQPGFPSPNSYGVIAVSKATASPGGGSVMRMIQFKPPTITGKVADFTEITNSILPVVGTFDRWQASKIVFRDVDGDGDQDMVVVCNAPPGGTEPAFRVLLNDIVNGQTGIYREDLKQLILNITTSTEHYEGDTMCVGDANRDGAADFFVTRAGTTSPSPQTRIVLTDRQ